MLMFSSSDVANVLLLLFDEISQATSLFLAGKPHRLPGADTRKYAVSNQRRTRFCCYTASRTVKFTMITIYPLFYLCSAIVSHGCFCSRSCTLAPYLTTRNHRSVLVGDSNSLIGSRLEKAQALTQEDRNDAHMDFVNQPGSEALLSGICAAYHHDMFLFCGGFGLLNRLVDAIGDEGHRQLVVLSFDHLLWKMMSQDKDRHLIFVIREIALGHVVGTSAHYHRAGRPDFFL